MRRPVDASRPARTPRLSRIAAWLTILTLILAWAAMQPPTRLEPLPWVGSLDI